jgi:hypothetical protein
MEKSTYGQNTLSQKILREDHVQRKGNARGAWKMVRERMSVFTVSHVVIASVFAMK